MTAELFRERLGGSKRAVKVALLDQRAVAGIGNLYASEILHLAGIHPAARCDKLTRAQWQAIADATHAVLEAAIRYEGSTLGDGTYRNALNQAGGYQNHHRVYDRAGEALPALRRGQPGRADRPGPAVDVFLSGLSAKSDRHPSARIFAAELCIRGRGFALMMEGRPAVRSRSIRLRRKDLSWNRAPTIKTHKSRQSTQPACDCCQESHDERRMPRRDFLTTAGGVVLGATAIGGVLPAGARVGAGEGRRRAMPAAPPQRRRRPSRW